MQAGPRNPTCLNFQNQTKRDGEDLQHYSPIAQGRTLFPGSHLLCELCTASTVQLGHMTPKAVKLMGVSPLHY